MSITSVAGSFRATSPEEEISGAEAHLLTSLDDGGKADGTLAQGLGLKAVKEETTAAGGDGVDSSASSPLGRWGAGRASDSPRARYVEGRRRLGTEIRWS